MNDLQAFTPFVVAGVVTGAIYTLAAVGIVVLYRASGVVNFAQGAIGAVGAFVAWTLVESSSPQWLAWTAGTAVSILLSMFYGRLLSPRLAFSDPVVRAVGTLSFALVLLGFMGYVWGEAPRRLRLPTDLMSATIFDVQITATRGLALGIAVVVAVGMMVFLGRTRLGLQMRALAADRELSAMLGVKVLRVDMWSWGISGALAGVSGILLADLQRLSGQVLTFVVIPAIAAAVVGRFTSLPATVFGGLVIGVAEAVLTPVPVVGPFRTAVPFVVAVAALIWLQRQQRFVFR